MSGMGKKLKWGIVAAVLLAVIVAVILCIPEKTTITVLYTNPEYSTMEVTIKISPQEDIQGFDMALLYNTQKWKLDESTLQCLTDDLEVGIENGQIHLLFEGEKGRTLNETVLRMSFEMTKKQDDPLGLRLEVAELYGKGNLQDIDYVVKYQEGK